MVYDFLKRILDIIGSLVGIIVFSPIMLVTSLAIKLETPGPVFADTPKRVSKDGKLFKMYKFRSMFMGAHDMLHNDPKFKDLLAKYKQNSYKLDIDEDPRITRVGKFIRKTSFDELPQFFNILKGEMSLVGPRAYYPFELEEQQKRFPESKEYVLIILTAKPGLTGLWQTSGRSHINFDDRVKLDAKYVLKRSIFFDIWILLKTIPAILTARGAV
jgi:exopolysaccharide production protein ExoY